LSRHASPEDTLSRSIRRARSPRRILVGLMAVGLATSAGFAGPARGSAPVEAAAAGVAEGGAVGRPGAQPGLASAVDPRAVDVPAATAFNPAGVNVDVSVVESGFSSPVLVTHAGDGSGRLFVVEQTGKIRIIAGGTTLATPFLDLETAIATGGEQGLLGLAFNPLFPTRPYIYVSFTDLSGRFAVSRYTVGADPDVAVRSSGIRVLTIDKPYSNHNGGHMAFGADGYLYIGTGDGGGAGDPGNRAQSLNSLLGKILRINVDRGSSKGHYAVPAANPYVGKTGLDEIWSRGLRNPWRWSFDRATRQMWIADVGQDRWEEVNRSSPRGSTPAGRAVNFGWKVLEGRACYAPMTGCSTSGKQPPQAVYPNGAGNCAVTGGYVYRGSAYPALVGGYLFGDFCSGRMWVMSPLSSAPVTPILVRDTGASPNLSISSFGEDEAGELYVCDLGGTVYRVTATAKP
jgi:glucose/arabinose dehydrogenase